MNKGGTASDILPVLDENQGRFFFVLLIFIMNEYKRQEGMKVNSYMNEKYVKRWHNHK